MNITRPNYSLCESEEIHLCGKVQQFGFLILIDEELKIVALSENCDTWIEGDLDTCLESNGKDFLFQAFPNIATEICQLIESLLNEGADIRQVFETKLNDTPVYLSVYAIEGYCYLEFEIKQDKTPSLLNLHLYSQKIDQSGHEVWNTLCEIVHQIVGYDRIMVYQFLEDHSGQVIAEKVRDGLESYMDLRYPEFDIPKQARALYLKHLTRLTSDIDSPTYALKTTRDIDFDLTCTSIRALSPTHVEYLRNAGAQASMSFSIVMHGKLWGLVACQNETALDVDLVQRRLGLFVTQYTVNKYLSILKERDLQYQRKFKEFELLLNEKLIIKNDLISVLNDHISQFAKLANADGVAIYNKEEVITHGSSPDKEEIIDLHNYLGDHTSKLLYISNRFKIKHSTFSRKHGFSGVVRIDIDSSRDFSIYWFRDEHIFEEKWSGKPEKHHTYDAETNTYNPSPRTSFEVWKQLARGTAIRWNENEIFFMKRMRKLIRESLLRKSNEIKQLNERLILLNNSLDTYAYTITHDLKNPLSVVKLSGQMLNRCKDNLTPEYVQKSAKNILDSVQLMEDLMSKVLEFSRAKIYEYEPECIDVAPSIMQIIDQCVQTYNMSEENIEVKNLLPVWGEKTLLYQLFLNLISNAIKYSSQSEAPKITIDSVEEGNETKYLIQDNGIGIASDELKEIYNLFKRLSNSASFEGSGVGLAIVKRIIDRLDADIKIDSELGVGTTFTITFHNG